MRASSSSSVDTFARGGARAGEAAGAGAGAGDLAASAAPLGTRSTPAVASIDESGVLESGTALHVIASAPRSMAERVMMGGGGVQILPSCSALPWPSAETQSSCTVSSTCWPVSCAGFAPRSPDASAASVSGVGSAGSGSRKAPRSSSPVEATSSACTMGPDAARCTR